MKAQSQKAVSKAIAASRKTAPVDVSGFEGIGNHSSITLSLPTLDATTYGRQLDSIGDELRNATECLGFTTAKVKKMTEKQIRRDLVTFAAARMVFLSGEWHASKLHLAAMLSDAHNWSDIKDTDGGETIGRKYVVGAIEFRVMTAKPKVCNVRYSPQYRTIKKQYMRLLNENPVKLFKAIKTPGYSFVTMLQSANNADSIASAAKSAIKRAENTQSEQDGTAPVGTPDDIRPSIHMAANATDSLKRALLESTASDEVIEKVTKAVQSITRELLGLETKTGK